MNQKGFTLVESIVATAIFAFVIVSILGVYIAVLNLDTRTRAYRAVADNSRFIMDFLSKEVREGHINYTSYPSGLVSNTTSDLYLINQNNEAERIYLFNQTQNQIETNTINCLTDICNLVLSKGSATSNLNSSSVKVTRLYFYATPDGDPFTAAKTYNLQPGVTVILQLTSNIASRDNVKIDLESTFSTLYYPTRQ
ncbi:MAG TPA: prepilin-type N-terminal cleavage/methylation domain-containing protein [Patescibacteria group bacterium]